MSLELKRESEALRQAFYELETPRDVARILEVTYDRLIYHLHKTDPQTRYKTFHIPKRSGGNREISAPATSLKIIQRKLNQVLQAAYPPRAQVHGFVYGKSILTNATQHIKKRLILKIDIQNFFPTINFGRVRGMFMAYPYSRNEGVATVLAQICCFNNSLPQGAPTSPIVSNMVCAKMDSELLGLARSCRSTYTRYADDLTFSTFQRRFPPALAKFNAANNEISIGGDLLQIIESNCFQVNPKKVRLLPAHRRQIVTGLITSKFPNVSRQYVNRIRAMLYAWGKYQLSGAEQHFHEKHDRKYRCVITRIPSFSKVVEGKIEFLGHVRGRNNPTYLKFRHQLETLAPHLGREDSNVYWFPKLPLNPYQLTLDFEEALGINLLPETDSDEIDGHLKIHTKTVSVEICSRHPRSDRKSSSQRILTRQEEEILRRTYETHVPKELTFQGEMGQIVTRYAPSVGRIVVTNALGVQKFATGFIVSKQNLMLTAAHVVDPEQLEIQFVEFEKVQVKCKILWLDMSLDVALLELEQQVNAWPLRIKRPLRMPQDRGMHCVTIGFPDEPGYVPRSVPVELYITDVTGNYILKQEILTLSRSLGSGTSGSPIINKARSLVGMVIGFGAEQSADDVDGNHKQKQKWSAAAVSCNDLAPILQRFE